MSEPYSLRLIRALSACWSGIQHLHPDVPDVVLLPSPARSGRRALGHFAALRWSSSEGSALHEVAVVAEHLDRSAEFVFETLMHEAAHARNFALGIRDCTASQYHNKHFKASAELLGLSVERTKHYGWAKTSLTREATARFQLEVDGLASVLIHRRGRSLTRARSGSRLRKATCACPLIIRASRAVLSRTRIICETCNTPFQEEVAEHGS